MSSILERLEQTEHIRNLLVGDLGRLKPRLGERSVAVAHTAAQYANRRAYVRATFALVEALVEQHARLLVDLESGGAVSLTPEERAALSETTYEVRQGGQIRMRDARLSLDRKLRLVYRLAGEVLGEPLAIRFDDQGWVSFREAQRIRDALMHPKTPHDCYVDERQLNKVDSAEEWYRVVHNEFTRVAEQHRASRKW
ncbi:MAG: hypothetical protein Q8K99_11025 [Actinomycetota bacterium]|nr:hypothetical protein [Actinomycetota bacterium]